MYYILVVDIKYSRWNKIVFSHCKVEFNFLERSSMCCGYSFYLSYILFAMRYLFLFIIMKCFLFVEQVYNFEFSLLKWETICTKNTIKVLFETFEISSVIIYQFGLHFELEVYFEATKIFRIFAHFTMELVICIICVCRRDI